MYTEKRNKLKAKKHNHFLLKTILLIIHFAYFVFRSVSLYQGDRWTANDKVQIVTTCKSGP